jgi:uncharacterized protein (TIGR00299 family) protein
MKTLYFDIVSGASGDMILSVLIDLGVPQSYLQTQLDKLQIPGLSIITEKVNRSAIECSHLLLTWDEPHHHHHDSTMHDHAHHHGGEYRNKNQIMAIINAAGYSEQVTATAEKILLRLATAEAAVHGVPIEKVHFHEIGAIDTIIDIAGIALALDYLKVDALYFSALTDGHGTIHTQHGIMPVPVPAVAKLCEGFSLNIVDVSTELLTPTGCAVLTTLGTQSLQGINGTIQKIGYGCGDKVFDTYPNIIRAFITETTDEPAVSQHDSVQCLESDMDHVTGEIMGDTVHYLFDAGALDVTWMPVFMKKGRPGYRLTVLCHNDKKDMLIALIIRHTRTLGVRYYQANRSIAQRCAGNTTLHNEIIAEKHCSFASASFSKPEYESLAALSRKSGIPIIELIEDYERKKNGQ